MERKGISLLICLAACIIAGCSEMGEDGKASPSDGSVDELAVAITSPVAGSVLSGDKAVSFDSNVEGGKKPYSYRWSSSLDGTLSTERSFSKSPSEMSKGRYTIILTVTGGSGASDQASITVTVL
ncbi:PKD domain-containing protein [Methanocrinis sp.]|uniref:PKD domain-containing protein n=1 Tax=Methanocrinis sp. TaxID=3101522 RepID=UPI003D127CA4